MNFTVVIERNEGIPNVPAPFFADNRPSWTAVLSQMQYNQIRKHWEKPSSRFIKDVKEVHVNGIRVFPR